MQLRQPEALRMLDHHHGRLRNIDTHLNHGGGHQDLASPICKVRQH